MKKTLLLIFIVWNVSSAKGRQIKTPVTLADTNRAMPPALQSPPFPSGDYTGSPIIGEPDGTPDYPLQKLLFGNRLDKSHLKLYGWINPSINYSTTKLSNVPISYNIIPNRPVLDQLVLRFERPLNTAQTDHFDFGFRITGLYGVDYRFTTAKGWFSNQLIRSNNLYGFDPVEAYGLLYFPHFGEGFVIKFGRYISPPDIEAQLAPDNYMYSHSIMFTYDPFTFTGIQSTLRLSKYWQVELGLTAGNDMAPWSNSASPTGEAVVRYVSPSNDDSFLGGIDMIGKAEFNHNHDDLSMVSGTWGHRFNKTFHMMTEAYYEWQYNAELGGSAIFGPVRYGTGGGAGPIIPGRSDAVGAVNYFQILCSSSSFFSIRNDFLWDQQGQRTGFKTTYSSHTIGFNHYFNALIVIRPEIRYGRDYANGVNAYDAGKKNSQFTAATDIIVRF